MQFVFGVVLGLPLSDACVKTPLKLQGCRNEFLAVTRVVTVRCSLLTRLASYNCRPCLDVCGIRNYV